MGCRRRGRHRSGLRVVGCGFGVSGRLSSETSLRLPNALLQLDDDSGLGGAVAHAVSVGALVAQPGASAACWILSSTFHLGSDFSVNQDKTRQSDKGGKEEMRVLYIYLSFSAVFASTYSED
jgi:hypothetical protein